MVRAEKALCCCALYPPQRSNSSTRASTLRIRDRTMNGACRCAGKISCLEPFKTDRTNSGRCNIATMCDMNLVFRTYPETTDVPSPEMTREHHAAELGVLSVRCRTSRTTPACKRGHLSRDVRQYPARMSSSSNRKTGTRPGRGCMLRVPALRNGPACDVTETPNVPRCDLKTARQIFHGLPSISWS